MSLKYDLITHDHAFIGPRIIFLDERFGSNVNEISLKYSEILKEIEDDICSPNFGQKISKIRIFDESKNAFLKLENLDEIKLKKSEIKRFEIECIPSMKRVNSENLDEIGQLMKEFKELKSRFEQIKSQQPNSYPNPNDNLKMEYGKSVSPFHAPLFNSETELLTFQQPQPILYDILKDYYSSKAQLVVLYSSPLIYEDEKGEKFSLPLKDCENEVLEIKKAFEKFSTKLEILFAPLSLEILNEVISREPIVLHIICHGYYDGNIKKDKIVFFEKSEFNGKAAVIKQSKLEEILSKKREKLQNLKLVFINSCYSIPIKEAFINSGSKTDYIEIHPSEEFIDTSALLFISTFYSSIASGLSVKVAYDQTIQSLKRNTETKIFQNCCCSHSHLPNCDWAAPILKGQLNCITAHELHVPICKCMFLGSKHLDNCNFAISFYNTYDKKEDYIVEWKNHCEDNYISKNKPIKNPPKSFLCCCRSKEHKITYKFSYTPGDTSEDNNGLFKSEIGIPKIIKYHNLPVTKNFRKDHIIGRNIIIQNIIEKLLNQDTFVLNLYGIEGIGKTSILLFLKKYISERWNSLMGGCLVDIEDIKPGSVESFIRRLRDQFCPEKKNQKDFDILEVLGNLQQLIIFDKAHYLIERDGKLFREKFIQGFCKNIRKSKIIIVSNSKLGENCSKFKEEEIAPLTKKEAGVLFLSKYQTPFEGNFLMGISDFEELIKSELFLNTNNLYPKSLIEKFDLLKSKKVKWEEINLNHSAKKFEFLISNRDYLTILNYLYVMPDGIIYSELINTFRIKDITLRNFLMECLNTHDILNKDEVKETRILRFKLDPAFLGWSLIQLENETLQKLKENYNKEVPGTILNILKVAVSSLLKISQETLIRNIIERNLTADLDEFSFLLRSYQWYNSTMDELYKEINQYNKYLSSSVKTKSSQEANRLFNTYLKNIFNLFDYSHFLSKFGKDENIKTEKVLLDQICELGMISANIKSLESTKMEDAIEYLISIKKLMKHYEKNSEDLYLQTCLLLASIYNKVPENIYLNNALDEVKEGMILLKTKAGTDQFIHHQNRLYESDFTFMQGILNMKSKKGEVDVHFKDAKNLYSINDLNVIGFARCCYFLTLYNYETKSDEVYINMDVYLNLLEQGIEKIKTESKNIERNKSIIFVTPQPSLYYELLYLKAEIISGKNDDIYSSFDLLNNLLGTINPEECESIKTEAIIKKCKDKLAELSMKLDKEAKNLFMFLRAAPLVKNSQTGSFNALLPLINVPSTFRATIKNNFENLKNKLLRIYFGFLTIENIKKVVENGCSLLHLSTEYWSPTKLGVENEYGELIELSKEQLKELFKGMKEYSIDVLVLGNPQSLPLAKFFSELKIAKWVLGFNFSKEFLTDINDIFDISNLKYYSIIAFCTEFYFNIVDNSSILNSIEKANAEMIKYIQTELLMRGINVTENGLKQNIEIIPLFRTDQQNLILQFKELPENYCANIRDISEARCKIINVSKRETAFVGRHSQFYNIVRMLIQGAHVNLYGPAGIGKSSLAQEIGYFFHSKNEFINGIIYINLADIDTASKLDDILSKENIIQENLNKSLLILDNSDLFITDNGMIFSQYTNIVCLLISEMKLMNFQNISHKFYLNCVQLPPLSLNESTELIKYICHFQIPNEIVQQICEKGSVSYTKCIEKLVYNFKGNPNILSIFAKRLNEILEGNKVSSLKDIEEIKLVLPLKYESYLKEEKNLLIYCENLPKKQRFVEGNKIAPNTIIVCYKDLKSKQKVNKNSTGKQLKPSKTIFKKDKKSKKNGKKTNE